MKGTATPTATIPTFSYVCDRCGRIANWSKKVRPTTCHDCRLVEADLADPARIAALDRRLDPPVRTHQRTHCRQGHEFTADNIIIDGYGKRRCRQCRADQSRSQRAARRAAQQRLAEWSQGRAS